MFRTPSSRILLPAALLMAGSLVAQELPKAEKIMERFVQATGGKAYKGKRSMVTKGTMSMAGMQGSLTVYRAEPNLSFTEIELPGLGKMFEGFDGKVAWSHSAIQGPAVKSGDELIAAENGARFHSENWKDEYKQVQTLGTETVEGEPCYKVQATPHKGEPSTQYYSVKSGLLLKTQTRLRTAMGDLNVEGLLRDYRSEGGVLTPHSLVQSVAGQTVTLTFTSVEWNVEIPRGKFDPPAEVKALMAAKKPAPAKG